MRRTSVFFASLALFVAGCSGSDEEPNTTVDSGVADTGSGDTATPDTTAADTAMPDTAMPDTTSMDTAADTADSATADTADSATADTADTATADTADTATADTADGADGADAADTADTATSDTAVDSATDSADACVPATEICNGADDDCDGVVDEGCPASVSVTTPESTLTGFGSSTGGTAASDTCPAGSALVGVNVRVSTYLRQIQGICAPITVTENTSATPYTYTITSGTETTLTSRGATTGTTATAKCPVGSFVVRAEARAGSLVDQLTLGCAPLLVATSSSGFSIARGGITDLAPVGGTGGTPRAATTCTGDGVVNKVNVRTGDGVDYVQLGCATPVLVAK